MKKNNFTILLGLLFTALIIVSCEDEKEEEVSPYIGDYTITNATLASSVDIPYVIGENEFIFTLPAGANLTEMIQNSILGILTDCSPDASLIELNEDYSMGISCATSDESKNAGTWEEKENGTVLDMNFNSIVFPPQGYKLTVTNVKLENGIMSSTAIIPIPKDKAALIIAGAVELGVLPEGAIISDSAPTLFMFTLSMEFKQK